jgi:hypothetical protein
MGKMKHIIFISIILCISSCADKKVLLDNISRGIYDQNVKKQHMENLSNPIQTGNESLSYDQYQRLRKEIILDTEETPSEKEIQRKKEGRQLQNLQNYFEPQKLHL